MTPIAKRETPPRNRLFGLDDNLQTEVYGYLLGTAAAHKALAATHRSRDRSCDHATLYWTCQYSLAIAPIVYAPCADADILAYAPCDADAPLEIHIPTVKTPLQCCGLCLGRVVFAKVDRVRTNVFCCDGCRAKFDEIVQDLFDFDIRDYGEYEDESNDDILSMAYSGRGGYDND